jgi:hypothetical protein
MTWRREVRHHALCGTMPWLYVADSDYPGSYSAFWCASAGQLWWLVPIALLLLTPLARL